MKAMILAAGEGTRLRPLTNETPKVLVPINGVPQIEYTIRWLKQNGISEVAINLYHLGGKIREILGDGSQRGIRIVYSEETSLLGTAGGVKKLQPFFDDTFAVIYGDVLTDFDLSEMLRFHRNKQAIITLALQRASNPAEVGVVELDETQRVVSFIEKPSPSPVNGALISGGIYIMKTEVLDYIPEDCFCDFGFEVFPNIIQRGLPAYGYRLRDDDYLLDIGNMEKYQKANEDVRNGMVKIYNGHNKAVFLDRDGTIAPDVNYCSRPEDFEVFADVPQAIRLLNESGFKVVIITNQSGIARGYFTEETLALIHQKMKEELARGGASIDAIYYCPHHPDEGCDCRKPRTALFRQAAKDLGIDFLSSFMIGDMEMDIKAGKAIGCKTILVTSGTRLGEEVIDPPDFSASNLLEAVRWILTESV
jgi:mannose-1-phosphate guanylyltransferase/phosphomannomutase